MKIMKNQQHSQSFRNLGTFFASCSLLSLGFLSGGTQEIGSRDILHRYLDAIGGEVANSKIKTRSIQGYYTGSHLKFYDVDRLPFEAYFDGENRWIRIWPNSNIIETIKDGGGFRFYPGRGRVSIPKDELAFMLRDTLLGTRIHWKGHWDQVETLGPRHFGALETQAVKMVLNRLKMTVTRHFDAKTYLLIGTEVETPSSRMRWTYSDYLLVDGVRVPGKAEIEQGEDVHIYIVESVVNNPVVDPALFDDPAQ